MFNVGESLKVWPEWKIEKVIGRGSFGTVYEAVRKEYGVENHSAIKVLSIPMDKAEIDELMVEGYTMDQTDTYFKEMVDEFIKEIQFMETLKGIPNVVSIYDYKVLKKENEVGYEIYIRMELLTPLNDYLCDKKMTEQEVIKLGIDICSVLELCAKKRILHRDIKPENIFVNEFGVFKLGDFGVARTLNQLTGLLSQKGTYSYSAPEIIRGADYDEKSDLYSLGIVLYRLLNNNRFPFMNPDKQLLTPSEKMAAVERRIKGDALEKPKNASEEMSEIILKACEYMPERRYANANELMQALHNLANENTSPIEEEKPKQEVKKAPEKKQDTSYSNGLSSVVVENGLSTDNNKTKIIPIIIAASLVILLGAAYFLNQAGYFKFPTARIVDSNNVVTTTEVSEVTSITEENKVVSTSEDEQALEDLFIGKGKDLVYDTSDVKLNNEDSQKCYQEGMKLLKRRKYKEAGVYLAKSVRNKEWLRSYLRPEEITCFAYVTDDDNPEPISESVNRLMLYFESGTIDSYASIIMHYMDQQIDHYSFATTDPLNPHVLIMIDCSIDGEATYSELNKYAFVPSNRNKTACEGIGRELYRKGIELMMEGQYKEAGQYIINAVNCKDWFILNFQMETHINKDYYPNKIIYEGYAGKKVVLYWKNMKDGFSTVVSECYEEDENILSKYIVRMYDYQTGNVYWYSYDINGNFIEME